MGTTASDAATTIDASWKDAGPIRAFVYAHFRIPWRPYDPTSREFARRKKIWQVRTTAGVLQARPTTND